MANYLTIVRDGLTSMGFPINLVVSITRNLADNDILAVATRLAVVGVLAAVLRTFISKWQARIVEGMPPASEYHKTYADFSLISHCIHPIHRSRLRLDPYLTCSRSERYQADTIIQSFDQ